MLLPMMAMSLTDMCRLCLSKDNLVWVFDKRFETDSMKHVIFVTTGVQIHTTDAVSQKICEKCCHIIIKMFEFRSKSIRNDTYLNDQLKKIKGSGATEFPAPIQIKEEKKNDNLPVAKPEAPENSLNIHPTVRELYNLHPHIKLPRVCLKLDLKPMVTMKMGQVEEYFERRQLNFEKHCKLALTERCTARKKTLGSLPRDKLPSEGDSCPINGQIIPQVEENPDNGVLRPIKIKIIPKNHEKEPLKTKEPEVASTPQCHRKRKLSDSESSPTKENDRPEDVEQTRKLPSPVIKRSAEPVYKCDICESVQETAKALKRHLYKHLRCPFCRTNFRTVEYKTDHVKSWCLVKKALNNFPSVNLPRIKTDSKAVGKYREAFVSHFPSLAATPKLEAPALKSEPEVTTATIKQSEVIEILSDDEDVKEVPVNPEVPADPQPPIKPKVGIKGVPILNSIVLGITEMEVLRSLLTNYKPVAVMAEKETQTERPSNIEVDEVSRKAVFFDLKQFMHVYKVGVGIKEGPFGVSYGDAASKPEYKKMQLWNDLTPIDIKASNSITSPVAGSSNINSSALAQAIVEITQVGETTPTTSVCSGTSSVSCSDPTPLNSTHSHILAVGPAAASTFPSAKTRIPPSTSTKQSVPLSDNSTVATPPKKRKIATPPAVAANQDKLTDYSSNASVDPFPHSHLLQSMVLSSLLKSAPVVGASIAVPSSNSLVTPSSGSFTTSGVVGVASTTLTPLDRPKTTSSDVTKTTTPVSLARSTPPATDVARITLPTLGRPKTTPSSVGVTRTTPPPVGVARTAPPSAYVARTTPPPAYVARTTPPLVGVSNTTAPTSGNGPPFIIPSVPPLNSNQNRNNRPEHVQNPIGNVPRAPTPFVTQNTSAMIRSTNSATPRPSPTLVNIPIGAANNFYCNPHQTVDVNTPVAQSVSNVANKNNNTANRFYHPISHQTLDYETRIPVTVGDKSCPVSSETVPLPTAYSVGYSNVPTMVVNDAGVQPAARRDRRHSLPNAQHPYAPRASNNVQNVPQKPAVNAPYIHGAVNWKSTLKRVDKSCVPPKYRLTKPTQPRSYSNPSTLADKPRITEQPDGRFTLSKPVTQTTQAWTSQNVVYLPNSIATWQVSNVENSHRPGTSNSLQGAHNSVPTETVVSRMSADSVSRINPVPPYSECAQPQLGQIRVRNMNELT